MSLTEAKDLDGIRKVLERIADLFAAQEKRLVELIRALESIADSLPSELVFRGALPIPFVPVARSLATPDPKASLHNRLLVALQIVRDALDEGHTFPGAGTLLRDRLFNVEAILSAELGEPIWEGHSKVRS